MNSTLEQKLKSLPKSPGVYFHKNAKGEIIYVGKAAVLKNRVRQYFQTSRFRDVKTDALVSEITDVDWMEVETELDALFLEAELIRRYMPRYNILLRDDKALVYIRIDYDSECPTVTTTRRPLDDSAKYFGPYLSAYSVRQALKLLRRAFPFATKKTNGQKRASLHYHIGLDPGLEEGKTSLQDYRANLRKLIAVLNGKRKTIEKELDKDIHEYAKKLQFEQAAKARNQLFALQRLAQQVVFSDKEFLDISKDHALLELVDLLGLKKFPARIEGYDISHMQGTDVVASMVVFTNGVSNRSEYRKFKTKKDQNNDFDNMRETLTRRFSSNNLSAWGKPDLLLIDGGKGQLDAATKALAEAGIVGMPCIGLAKREEQIVIHHEKSNVTLNNEATLRLKGFVSESEDFSLVTIPHQTNVVKLLQRIRDESHRFAVSYHSTLKKKRTSQSILDEIPGVGPASRKKLLRAFGSVRALHETPETDIATVVGPKLAHKIVQHIQP